jgi:L-methionine (R)-S-oxide reductase
VIKNNEVVAVLDIDSEKYDLFDKTDQQYLEKIAGMINF